jgi:hypothetical protein
MSLEDFLAGKPVNERMARLMRGEDDAETETRATEPERNYADGTPITDSDRSHLRRMQGSAGWQVLLKLLDTALQYQEDAARRMSLNRATPKDEILTAWGALTANKEARNAVVGLVEAEVEKLKRGKAKAGAPQR